MSSVDGGIQTHTYTHTPTILTSPRNVFSAHNYVVLCKPLLSSAVIVVYMDICGKSRVM